jgi:hypothetical protein
LQDWTKILDRVRVGAMANVEGRATAITVLTPYKPTGRLLLPLVFWIGRHVTATLKKLHMLSFIHYARWVMVKRFPDGGRGERLRYPYLMFESNFNGSWDQYIDAFSEVVPARMRGIWGTSYGFPGPIPVEPFKQYIRANEYVANHYWNAYPGATTTEIISAAKVAAALDDLRARAPAMDPVAFKAAYEDMLTAMQHDL